VATADATATAPPGEAEITVVDTAGFTSALASFAAFVPGKFGALEKTRIGTLPAIIITNEDGREFTQPLVSSRYIVEITFTNLPRQRVADWLRGFHFDTLSPNDRALPSRSREFRLAHVDELQPANNRSYSVSATSTKRVNDFLKTLPAEPSADGPRPSSP
jgi:hypothetical protein